MTVLPIPQIPHYQQRYLNDIPPAGLQILERPVRVLPLAGMDGSGLPPDRISPYSGIYDENGKLPSPSSNTTFIARI